MTVARLLGQSTMTLAVALTLACGASSSGSVGGDGVGGVDPRSSGGSPNVGGTGPDTSGGSGGGAGNPVERIPLTAIAANETVGLEWPRVHGALSYNLYWSNEPGVSVGSGERIEGAERGYVHRGLTNGQAYYYMVTAVTGNGEGSASEEATATPSGEWVLEQLGTGDFDDVLTGEPIKAIPVEQRVHVFLFGEGYTSDNLHKFHDHTQHFDDRRNDVDRWVDLVFGIEPYSLFPEAFVVWYLPRPSSTTIRDASPDTAFQVPIVMGTFPQMGSVASDGETARRAWQAILMHPYAPTDFSGPSTRRARNAVASFIIFDPERDRASVSGRATSLTNPSDTNQRIGAAFGVGHAHEFSHAFAILRDEYMENDNTASDRSSPTSNVVGTNACSELPWSHLLLGSEINPDMDELVGAFGQSERGFHSELLCLMNGTHENGEYFSRADSGACRPDSCTLRVEGRFCNFCRETTSFRIFERTGVLPNTSAGFDEWVWNYRARFYERFEFQVPGVHYEGLLPQSNDRQDPTQGTQIFQSCAP